MRAPTLHLLPAPRAVEARGAGWSPGGDVRLDAPDTPATTALASALGAAGLRVRRASEPGDLRLVVEPDPERPEGYELVVTPSGARVVGADAAGLAHGTHTLAQLVRTGDELPGVRILDAPSFRHRGVMLDVSRDRVPTMETLYALVDRFASWKLNELQLYTEHTFAYAAHEEVWRDASPLTAAEVRSLDAYCAARHVRLVPNQQCFGHMHRWLVHARYRHLAECPDGVEHPFLVPGRNAPEPFSLAAADPASLAFVAELLDELLPNFHADVVNVGCDETFDLGRGRSRAACEEQGIGRVYLDYLKGLARLARERGRRAEVWADILCNHPERIGDLPDDVIPMLWGYEATHPFPEQAARLAASGLPFHVCPGTSSWQSLAGRLENATANIASAVASGREHGAAGVLVTDWGDRGHLQPETASWIGWLTAADLAWNADAPAQRRSPGALAAHVSRHVLGLTDPEEPLGRALVDLAGVAARTGARIPNASPLSVALTRIGEPFPPPGLEHVTLAGLADAEEMLDSARSLLATPSTSTAHALVRRELGWSEALLRWALELSRARLEAAPGAPASSLPASERARLVSALERSIDEHEELWLARSRPGGRARSRRWLSFARDTLA